MRRALIAVALLWFGLAAADYSRTPSSRPQDASGGSSYRTPPETESSSPGGAAPFRPSIPQAWDEGTIANLQLPLADAKHSPQEISWEYYYRIPRRLIYKSYPVYGPGHEPPGYFAWLEQQDPQVVWGVDYDGRTHTPVLETKPDWIKAGELVFDAPIAYDADSWGSSVVGIDDVRDPAWYAAIRPPVSADGVLPFARYVIRKKGVVELGQQSCGMCHTRVLADGAVAKGAQGNFPFDRAAAWRLQELERQTKVGGGRDARAPSDPAQLTARVRKYLRSSFDAPWLNTAFDERINAMSLNQIAAALRAIPPGLTDRRGSSLFHPVQTPDLIGVEARHFLDHTGLVRQRSIGDLMSYAALNQDVGGLARYSGFVPEGVGLGALPDPIERSRYSDEQLYALALYVYSLEAPPNPYKFDVLATRGQQVFAREGCARCHTPPLYTNNRLAPADGFTPPADDAKEYSILPVSLHTDSTLALDTRRGTGYYKVPSLRGLWYRATFPHDGSCATLEDWFDPRRLRDDYVPTGFKGYGVEHRAVKGHEYGLDLSAEDKAALIAFLRTL
jgi:hypothetical protein